MPGVGICFFGLPILRIGETWVTFGIKFFRVIVTWVTDGVEFFGGLPLRRTVGVVEDNPSKCRQICQINYDY